MGDIIPETNKMNSKKVLKVKFSLLTKVFKISTLHCTMDCSSKCPRLTVLYLLGSQIWFSILSTKNHSKFYDKVLRFGQRTTICSILGSVLETTTIVQLGKNITDPLRFSRLQCRPKAEKERKMTFFVLLAPVTSTEITQKPVLSIKCIKKRYNCSSSLPCLFQFQILIFFTSSKVNSRSI